MDFNTVEQEVNNFLGTATYSPEDNKLRMYPFERLDRADYNQMRENGFKWAPKQELFVAPMWTPDREDLLIYFCGEIGDEDTSLVDRAEERAARFEDYSDKRAQDAHTAKEGVDAITKHIPMGQPILVGHHSEKRARKDAERIENGMRKAVKMWETSKYWEHRAEGAIRNAKYKERPDVRARRIKKIEAEIRKYKASYTPKHPDQVIAQPPWNCPVCGEGFCKDHPEAKKEVPHVWCGASRGGSWVSVDSLPKIEKSYRRWIAHCENRLVYEKAMLGEQGKLDLIAKKPRPKQLPLLNYRAEKITVINPSYYAEKTTTYHQFEMTKAEYSKIYKDYRGTRVVEGSHRVRICSGHSVPAHMATAPKDRTEFFNHKHRQVAVFLTDSKVHKIPKKEKKTESTPPAVDRLHGSTRAYTPPERTEFDDMKDRLRDGVKVVSAPQLFPTPKDIAGKMAEYADVSEGESVLEPSAGTGMLLGAIGCLWYGTDKNKGRAVVVEVNRALCDRLEVEFPITEVIHGDFLEQNGNLGSFDKIIMNPPFKNGEDIKHINHALTLLRPGGRLVALCANGPRQQKAFMDIAEHWEELPPDSFKEAGTRVNVAMMVLTA